MSNTLSSSITQSLDALSQNTLVIDNFGVILFANRSWNRSSSRCSLYSGKEWVGSNYFELLPELIAAPKHTLSICESLISILQGERLVFSSEFTVHSAKTGDRMLRLDAFPLMQEYPDESRSLVISHEDIGPLAEGRRIVPVTNMIPARKSAPAFLPICAACKSIRNDKEEWISIESFLQQHFSLQFTHDICPDCIRQLYPKYAAALKGISGS